MRCFFPPTDVCFGGSRQSGGVQQPVMEGLALEGDAVDVLASVDVPRAHTHPQFLRHRKVTPAITHGLLEGDRGCRGRGGGGEGGRGEGVTFKLSQNNRFAF